MAIYGLTLYGTAPTEGYYGNSTPPDYRVDPFTSVAVDYGSIQLMWHKPAGTIQAYRIVRNRYGYPVDEDDGDIILDSLSYPGSQFRDNNVIQGAYHYYGFYVLLDFEGDIWVRSGLTACLAIADLNSALWLTELIPGYFINATTSGDELSADLVGDTYLGQYLQVCGWGTDLIKTQYQTYTHINDPWFVPLDDLYNLATQMGININPDIHPYTLRKAIYFNASINMNRGTPAGLETEVSALTGWNSDLQVGRNFLLNNDQSAFSDPYYLPWSAHLAYLIGENVVFGNYFYVCTATGGIGVSPTGNSGSNAYWDAVLGNQDNTLLYNSVTGGLSTWEVLYPSVSNGTPIADSLYEAIGEPDPLNSSSLTHNSLRIINQAGSGTQNIWVRSVSRTIIDAETTTTTFAPDIYQAIADGIPVPFILPDQVWSPDVTYHTNDIVTYNTQPFIALRRSTGAAPPYAYPGTATREWSALSWDTRFRLCLSGYFKGTNAVAVVPFVEWYDSTGNFIMRLLASAGTPLFDSFCSAFQANSIAGRTTDDSNYTWTQEDGEFSQSPIAGGAAYPAITGQRTSAIVTSGTATCKVGVTFITQPEGGQQSGLLLRWQDDTHYIRADWETLKLRNGSTWTALGTYSTAFEEGDRMTVSLNGTAIIVYRNGVSVLSTTSSFNTSGLNFGIIVENS